MGGGRLRKFGRRKCPCFARNPSGIDGDPTIRRASGLYALRAEEHAVGMEAIDFARAAERAEGQAANFAGGERPHVFGDLRQGARLDDQHGKPAPVFAQPVSGVDERGEAAAHAVLFHIQFYVPAKADIPAAARQRNQNQRAQRGPWEGAAQLREPRRARAGADHERRALEYAKRAALRTERRATQQRRAEPRDRARPAEEQGKERKQRERELRRREPARMKAPQHALHRDQHAQIHQKIHREKRNGDHARTSL